MRLRKLFARGSRSRPDVPWDRDEEWASYRYAAMQAGALDGTADRFPEWFEVDEAELHPPVRGDLLAGWRPQANGGAWSGRAAVLASSHLGVPEMTPVRWPAPGPEVESLPGRWLYLGVASGHFGHFLVESLGRIWGLDDPRRGRLDGVVALADEGAPLPRPNADLLELVSPGLRLKVLSGPGRADQLVLPRQESLGGIGMLSTPRQVSAVRSRLAHGAKGGCERVFVSRAGVRPRGPRMWSGAIAAGEHLESEMSRSGVRVIRPEQLTLAEQLDVYRGARLIVLEEGSAVHLVAAAARPDATVLVLGRRPWYALLLEAYLSVWLGPEARVRVLDVPGRYWQMPTPFEIWLDVELPRLQQRLAQFDPAFSSPAWRSPSSRQVEAELAAAANDLGGVPSLLRTV